ncbi:sensor histidine kinase [Methylovirgula sp. 4M-Z18]|uniref:sensor histidine kinase n=1 Tax=Methylovirgula sp. 4M-Z18 TaxID=2293567 RepID=UPI0018F452AF|nr:ATP-binding protein [Methylovirgula sp. 4M-Z18]
MWLSLATVILAIVAGVFSFFSAFDEAIELQDDQLRQVASLVHRQYFANSPAAPEDVPTSDPESRIIVLTAQATEGWKPQAEARDLPANLRDGLHTLMIGDARWRLFVLTRDNNQRVAVGQQTAVRDENAQNSALRTVAPLLLLVLILPLLAASTVRTMLRPLRNMAADFEKRSEQDWKEIRTDSVPSEVQPLVLAIRHLLSRAAESMRAQRRFLADAAHELRSPLTALSLQAERLGGADLSAEARIRLTTLRRGIARTRALLDQLLALARAQGEGGEAQHVSLTHVFRRVLEDVLPLAEGKEIDIGLVTQDDISVRANEVDLLLVLKNLIENAVRYTPAQGRVDIAVALVPDGAVVYVDDNGPGIPPDDRVRVFDPFYRRLGHDEVGSGLGLSIVKAIAERIGIDVSLDASPAGGLRAMVVFPKAVFHPVAMPPTRARPSEVLGNRLIGSQQQPFIQDSDGQPLSK